MRKTNQNDVKSYYELGFEQDRLKTGKGHADPIEGAVEKARTLQLLNRYLPKQSSTILDVGGASGAYSFWLAGLGHEVHLVDLTPLHIEQAKKEQEKQNSPKLASCQIGDACNLNFAENYADVVLCMGPLYHLQDPEERNKCLSEAFRVLKPGGLLFAVGISRFASLLDFLRIDAFNNSEIQALIERNLASGCHFNNTNNPLLFTTAYFHKPEDLREEIVGGGFCRVDVLAIEGPILFTKNLHQHWSEDVAKQRLMTFAEKVEREASIMGMSNHLAAVGYKPGPAIM